MNLYSKFKKVEFLGSDFKTNFKYLLKFLYQPNAFEIF